MADPEDLEDMYPWLKRASEETKRRFLAKSPEDRARFSVILETARVTSTDPIDDLELAAEIDADFRDPLDGKMDRDIDRDIDLGLDLE